VVISWGAAQKTVREKMKNCGERKRKDSLPVAAPFLFSRAVFRTAPQLTERTEEAKSADSLQNTALPSSVTQSIFVIAGRMGN